MCHAWITHWTVTRASPTIPRRRSMRDQHMHSQNARKPFLVCTRAYLPPRAPFLNCGKRDERANQRTEHVERPTYQIKHFYTHTGNITYDDHVLDSLNKIPPTARTTGRTAPSCQILHGWYTSQPTRQSCISGKRGID